MSGKATILDGKAVAAKVRGEVAARAADLGARLGRRPGLAVVQVGEDPASRVYVRNKRRAAAEVGIESFAYELLLAGATVTVCHTGTRDVRAEVERAELVVAAVGKPRFVLGEWIRPGAAVFDVGISHDASGKLVGDVEYEQAAERAGWITPVPGGIGPMTIAMLLSNAVEAASRRLESGKRHVGG